MHECNHPLLFSLFFREKTSALCPSYLDQFISRREIPIWFSWLFRMSWVSNRMAKSPFAFFFFQLHAPLFNLIRVSFSSTLLKNVSLNAEALGNFLHHKDFQRAVFLLWAGEREVPRKRWRESLVTCYKWGRNN